MMNKYFSSKYFPFQIFTVAVFIALIVPTLIKDGLFMDGQQYAIIAKNLANGLGTFWQPYVFATWWKAGTNSFLEHPPLVYGIQSIFFRILGDGMYTERIYSFTTAVISAGLVSAIWKLFSQTKEQQKLSWFPVFLWIIMPISFWSFQNNMQENTMGVFTLLSVFFAVKSLKTDKKSLFFVVLSGISVFLASLSKGVPGLFPIVTIPLYWLIFKEISFKKAFFFTLIVFLTPIILYSAFLLFHPVAKESLSFYFFERLVGRVNDSPTVDSRFWIIYKLLLEIAIPLVFVSIFLGLTKIRPILGKYFEKANIEFFPKDNLKKVIFFLILGFAGSVPLLLTSVQRAFYFAAALPYFGLAFGLLLAPILMFLFEKLKTERFFKAFKIFSLIFLLSVIVFSAFQVGKSSRHGALLEDVYKFGEIIPENSIVKVEPETYSFDWSFQYYMIRYFNICFKSSDNQLDYYLVNKQTDNINTEGWIKVELITEKYDLYKKTE